MRLREAGRRALARWRALVALGGLALTAMCALAAPAHAGAFRVSQCAAWDGTAWTARTAQGTLWTATGGWIDAGCGRPGGTLTLSSANYRLPHYGTAQMTLRLPDALAHTSIEGAWLDWTAMPQAPSTDPAYVNVRADEDSVLRVPSGTGTAPYAADHLAAPSASREISFQQWCSPRDGPGWCNWYGAEIVVRGLSLDLRESEDPVLEAGGSLLDGGPQRGEASVAIHATDADSGVRRVDVRLGGTDLGTVDLGAGCADDRLPVCPPSVNRTLAVDTTRLPEGAARLRLHAVDAAGNTADLDAGRVEVDNVPDAVADVPPSGPPAGSAGGGTSSPATHVGGPTVDPFPPNPLAGHGHVANGRGATTAARVSVRLAAGGRSGRGLTIAGGEQARVRGRLEQPDATPIGGALVTVVERIAGGRWRTAGVLRAAADGHFGGPLRQGPSREVAVVYRAYGDSPRGRWSRTLRLGVRARVRLQVVRAGASDRLRGTVVGGPIPRGGVLVSVERRVLGRWLVGERVRTDARGRFIGRGPVGGGLVRARVPAQAGYPYEGGASSPRRLP